MPELILCLAILFAVCFLLGSIPFGVLISKTVYRKDLRESGSGNIGATNALRVLGKAGGAAVFCLDFAKGLLAGFLGIRFAQLTFLPAALLLYDPALVALLAGSLSVLGAVMGHIFSPWLGFHGGKGVAVTAGSAAVVLGPAFFAVAILAFALVVLLTRYVSLGSLTAAALFLAYSLILAHGLVAPSIVFAVVFLLVVWAHRENIDRLVHGKENKLNLKKK